MELGNLLTIPSGNPTADPMFVEMGEVQRLEDRKNEVAFVTKETAPELLETFNNGYCIVTKLMAQVAYEYTKAMEYANRRKSIVILDEAPRILQEKNLTTSRSPGGSEDLRNAVLNMDEEYLKHQDRANQLEAIYDYLKSKAKGFEMAYQAAKKIYETNTGSLGSIKLNADPNANSDIGDSFGISAARY